MAMLAVFAGLFAASVLAAPSASAAGGEGKIETYRVGGVMWDLNARFSTHNSAKRQTQAPPSKGIPKPPVTVPRPPVVASSTASFNGGPVCIESDGGQLCYTFDQGITEGGCTVHPPADRNMGYNGNAIPLPARGQKAESRLVSWTVKLTKTQIDDITEYEDLIDPKDPSKGYVVIGEGIDTAYLYEYQWACNYQTAPEVSTDVCATWVKTSLNGPYDQNYKPMKSILEGGTNIRTPLGNGVFGTTGKVYERPSYLGEAMQAAGLDPKTDRPTLSIMQNYCIPKNNDGFKKIADEESSTLGRYEIPSETWYTRGYYYHFDQPRFNELYPAVAKSSNYKDGYQIIDITPPSPTKLTTYAKLICWDGSSEDGVIAKIYVGQGTAREWRVLDWGDSAENYYTWNCGSSPDNPQEVRQKDFLQCDRYGSKLTLPYQYDRLDYTYHSERRSCAGPEPQCHGSNYVDFGTDWSGTTCPNGGTMHDGHCLGWTTGWYDATVRDATPEGWSDNGSYWYKKAAPPAGWIDNGTAYETTTYANIVVDNKNAAPIIGVDQIIDGTATKLEAKNGVYQTISAADPIHVEWTRVRINTRDGQDVNVSGKNVQWEYQYRLAPWSSPMLKNADVNALNQPYHGWVDTTNTTAPGAMPVDRKWEPDKNYALNTIPYSYMYEPFTYTGYEYTYHTVEDLRPREVTTREWDAYEQTGWGFDWGCSCGGKCGNWPNGDPYCQYPTFGWVHHVETIVAPAPAGCYDNGSVYVCSRQERDATPDGMEDFGGQWQKRNPAPEGYTEWNGQWRKKNEPPVGYYDNGVDGYTSYDPINDGFTGGIAFNQWRKWPTYNGLTDCEVNPSDYNKNQKDRTYKIKCGDNVTERTRSAYFRYFMSSTAGAKGWQVVPWWRVTADIQTDYYAVDQIQPDADGDAALESSRTGGKWIRQQYECPGQPFLVNINRIAQ